MAKTWKLDTETKGTGANVVPFDAPGEPRLAANAEPLFAPQRRPPRAEPAQPPAPRPPRRFRIVDVLNGRALLEDGDARSAVAALGRLHSVVDARVYIWGEKAQAWQLLTLPERRALWELRGRSPVPQA